MDTSHGIEVLGSLLKNPAVGNGTSGVLFTLIAVLVVNPNLSPFAYADHEHDVQLIQTVVQATVKTESLRTFIELTEREIDDYTTQIQLSLCIQNGCAYETAQLKRAVLRKDRLDSRLDRRIAQPLGD